MIRCPNCGSSAQVRIDDHQTFVWKDTVSLYLIYTCGCGYKFVTRLQIDRDKEQLYGEIKKEEDED